MSRGVRCIFCCEELQLFKLVYYHKLQVVGSKCYYSMAGVNPKRDIKKGFLFPEVISKFFIPKDCLFLYRKNPDKKFSWLYVSILVQ